jgi:RNA polymerase sigma-70 factor (ECF subfamily)
LTHEVFGIFAVVDVSMFPVWDFHGSSRGLLVQGGLFSADGPRSLPMPPEDDFAALVSRVRAGDPEAAAQLVRDYEPTVRRIIRIRLRDARLRSRLDTMDICQSVLGSFFIRAALGQFDLNRPDDLLKLLAKMVRNKLSDQIDAQKAACRDYRRTVGEIPDEGYPAAAGPTPSQEVLARELLEQVRSRLTREELHLLEMRQQDREWGDIARELGANPEALRKKLTRAMDRVAEELRLDE